MLRAVFFDLYNTLARFYPPREELQAAACRRFGITVSPEGIARGYAMADAYLAQESGMCPLGLRDPLEREQVMAEYQQRLLQGAGVEVDRALAGRIFAALQQIPSGLVLFDDVLPVLQRLRQRGLVTGLISNLDQDPEELCRGLGLGLYLDLVVTSREVGMGKPHPPIFQAALTKAAVTPSEALYVGDQWEGDCLGPRRLGMHALLIDRYGTLGTPGDCPVVRGLGEVLAHVEALAHRDAPTS